MFQRLRAKVAQRSWLFQPTKMGDWNRKSASINFAEMAPKLSFNCWGSVKRASWQGELSHGLTDPNTRWLALSWATFCSRRPTKPTKQKASHNNMRWQLVGAISSVVERRRQRLLGHHLSWSQSGRFLQTLTASQCNFTKIQLFFVFNFNMDCFCKGAYIIWQRN